jgi:hypothetical protein
MRVRWQFFYQTSGFKFGHARHFNGAPVTGTAVRMSVPAFKLEVLPDQVPKFDGADESGEIHITLPGTQADTKALVHTLVARFAQRTSLDHGPMKVHFSLVTGEHLPENPSEAEAVKDRPYFAEVHLEEYIPPKKFDSGSFSMLSDDPKLVRLLSVFNAAQRAATPIDKFLGLFKVLEDCYCTSSSNRSTAKQLKDSQSLFSIGYGAMRIRKGAIRAQPTREEFNDFLESLVELRDQCAHLRSDVGLGIAPNDAQVRVRLEPVLPVLAAFAHESIRRVERASSNE